MYFKILDSHNCENVDCGLLDCDSVMLCSLARGYQHFGGMYHHHFRVMCFVFLRFFFYCCAEHGSSQYIQHFLFLFSALLPLYPSVLVFNRLGYSDLFKQSESQSPSPYSVIKSFALILWLL
jgi:hypothetical protein